MGPDSIENVLDRGVVDAIIASGAPNFFAFLGGESPNKSSNFIDETVVDLPKREGAESPELDPVALNEFPEVLRLCLRSEGLVKLDDFLRLDTFISNNVLTSRKKLLAYSARPPDLILGRSGVGVAIGELEYGFIDFFPVGDIATLVAENADL